MNSETPEQSKLRQQALMSQVEEKLARNGIWVSDHGTKFSLVEFPGSTLVHTDSEVELFGSVHEEAYQDTYAGYEPYTINLLRISLQNPGLAFLPCQISADNLKKVIEAHLRQAIRFSSPGYNPDTPFTIHMDLWEEVFQVLD